MTLRRIIPLAVLVLAIGTSAAASVTLAWDASPDPTVTGYNAYYGVVSRLYTNQIDASNRTSVVISNLVPCARYYFAVTAYNTNLESDFSAEVSYLVPVLTNGAPTLNPLANLTLFQEMRLHPVALTGISSGSPAQTNLIKVTERITPTSGSGPVPTALVGYTSPGTNGTFYVIPNVAGAFTVTVTVNNGERTNNLFSQAFSLSVTNACFTNRITMVSSGGASYWYTNATVSSFLETCQGLVFPK